MLITVTGWTFEYIDHLTMHQVDELMLYWKDSPPVHVILAARYLKPRPKKITSMEGVEELAVALGQPVQKMPAELSEAIAWAESQKEKFKIN